MRATQEKCNYNVFDRISGYLDLNPFGSDKMEHLYSGYSVEKITEVLNETYPGLSMYVRDVNLPQTLVQKYTPGQIICERGFTDASCRVMGMATTFRYAILSNHMVSLGEYEHGTNWGLFVAQRSSHFKVIGKTEYHGKTALFLLHLPNDDSWKMFQDITLDKDNEILSSCITRFRDKCEQPPIPELATDNWLDRCKNPLEMDENGVFFNLE